MGVQGHCGAGVCVCVLGMGGCVCLLVLMVEETGGLSRPAVPTMRKSRTFETLFFPLMYRDIFSVHLYYSFISLLITK